MTRIEFDVITGEVSVINRKAYINDDGETLVIDEGESPPDGYKEVIPDPKDKTV